MTTSGVLPRNAAPNTTAWLDNGDPEGVMPYTFGLAGVNIAVDNISSRLLYGMIGFICIVILLVRTAHQINAHLRHISSFSATPAQQEFWKRDPESWWPSLKKHLIYAPLKNKRHNREMQLSKAINVGTIPSRLHTLFLFMFLGSQVAYCCILDYHKLNKAAVMAEFRGRTGHLSTMNLIILFVLAGRNNPLIRLLRVSFDTFNLFHRWIGRVVIIEAVLHTVAWAINKHAATGWEGIGEAVRTNGFIQYGSVGTIALVVIFFQAPSAIRHAFYETFLALHQAMAFVALVGIIGHAQLGPLPQMPFLITILCIWGYDRLYRLFRLVYRNIAPGRGVTRVTVEALPGEACRVTFHLPRAWTPPPGAHVYAYLPSVSLWQSHPFSVAWSESNKAAAASCLDAEKAMAQSAGQYPSSVSLIMSARTGMTRKLYDKASQAPTNTLHITGALEGPYGALESLHSYGTVMLFAGGVGITHMMPHVRDLLSRHDNNTAAVRKITLVWSIRSTEPLEWVRPWMEEILSMPSRRGVLTIKIFVTRPRSPTDVISPSRRVQMFSGRPKMVMLVQEEFGERIGAMTIGVCGPGAYADDVRDAARRVVDVGKVDFWEEGFTW